MGSIKTPPRLGLRVPLPPAPREQATGETNPGLAAGDLLEGRYQIEDRLGEGGVGFVYRARQIKLHRRVAVKLLQNDMVGEEALKPRFEREALTLAALSHPNIVSLNDYGMVRGQPFLVMELLEGRTLREILDTEGALDPGRALSFARQMLLAAAYAHSMGIVHRDFKPANLLIQALPCCEHLKVLDFGLVKLLPGSYLDSGVQLSRVGFTFGTPSYMSPEHASGADVDGRADLYAVGVLLFEMLTGKKPFDGELQDILRHHFQTPVPELTSIRPELAAFPYLAPIVNTAMAKDRGDRYPDAAAMLAVVDGAIARLRAPAAGLGAADSHVPVLRSSEAPRVRALSAEAQRVGNDVVRKARDVLRAGQRRSAPHVQRIGQYMRVGMVDAVRNTRVLSGRAWVLAKPTLRRAASSLLSLASQARSRIAVTAQRLKARANAAPLLPEHTDDAPVEAQATDTPPDQAAEPPPGPEFVAKTLVDTRGAEAAALHSDYAPTVAVKSVRPGAPDAADASDSVT